MSIREILPCFRKKKTNVADFLSKESKATLWREIKQQRLTNNRISLTGLCSLFTLIFIIEAANGLFPTVGSTKFILSIVFRVVICLSLGIGAVYVWKRSDPYDETKEEHRRMQIKLGLVWIIVFIIIGMIPTSSDHVYEAADWHLLIYIVAQFTIAMGSGLEARFVLWICLMAFFVKAVIQYTLLKSAMHMDYHLGITLTSAPWLGVVGYFIQQAFQKAPAQKYRYYERQLAAAEHKRADRVIDSLLPPHVANLVREGRRDEAAETGEATIMFCNVVTPSEKVVNRGGEEGQFLDKMDRLYTLFDQLVEDHGLYTVERLRDVYVVAGGTKACAFKDSRINHAATVSHLAVEIHKMVKNLFRNDFDPWTVRIGIHTGTVTAAVLGDMKYHYTLLGDSMNISSRLMSNGEGKKILVSAETIDSLGEKVCVKSNENEQDAKNCQYKALLRGEIGLKGRGSMTTYWLEGIERAEEDEEEIGDIDSLSDADSILTMTTRICLIDKVRFDSFNLTFKNEPELEEEFQIEKVANITSVVRNSFLLLSIAWIGNLQGEWGRCGTFGQPAYCFFAIYNVASSIFAFLLFFYPWKKEAFKWVAWLCWIFAMIGMELPMQYFRMDMYQPVTQYRWVFSTGATIFFAYVAHIFFCQFKKSYALAMTIVAIILENTIFLLRGVSFATLIIRVLYTCGSIAISTYAARNLETFDRYRFLAQREVLQERARSEQVLKTLLPAHAADIMMSGDNQLIRQTERLDVVVVQADVVNFTTTCVGMTAPRVSEMLNQLFSAFDKKLTDQKMTKLYTVGDAYIAAAGIGIEYDEDRKDENWAPSKKAEYACKFALSMIDCVNAVNKTNIERDLPSNIAVRIGIGSGKAKGGLLGQKSKPMYLLWGHAVKECEEMEHLSNGNQILLSKAVASRLKKEYGGANVSNRPKMRMSLMRRLSSSNVFVRRSSSSKISPFADIQTSNPIASEAGDVELKSVSVEAPESSSESNLVMQKSAVFGELVLNSNIVDNEIQGYFLTRGKE